MHEPRGMWDGLRRRLFLKNHQQPLGRHASAYCDSGGHIEEHPQINIFSLDFFFCMTRWLLLFIYFRTSMSDWASSIPVAGDHKVAKLARLFFLFLFFSSIPCVVLRRQPTPPPRPPRLTLEGLRPTSLKLLSKLAAVGSCWSCYEWRLGSLGELEQRHGGMDGWIDGYKEYACHLS